jgi:hypothetical protein
MAGTVLKGALISFLPAGALGVPSLPNVIVFQINPESMTHTWTEATAPPPAAGAGKPNADPLAVAGVPGETFSFTLFLDANEEIANADRNPVGAALAGFSGVYPRLSALELLQYPTGSVAAGLLGQVSASIGASGLSVNVGVASSSQQNVPVSQVPVVLFVWGPQRIVPVRVTALTITERLYDAALNPIHAEAQITLRVLTPQEVVAVQGPMQGVALVAYAYMQNLRQAQAAANLGDSAATIIGMLPTPF